MKRLVVSLMIVLFVSSMSSMLNAGLDAVPHITIGGLMKISGAGRNLALGHINVSDGTIEETDGFDVKDSARKMFSTTINPAKAAREAEENTSFEARNFMKLIAGETLPDENFLLSALLPYPEFNDKVWADMKYRSIAQARTVSILPKAKISAKKLPADTVPSAKTGLINPRNPIEIITFADTITLSFAAQIEDSYTARLLDSKGRELGGLEASSSENPSIEISIPDKADDYYLEFSSPIGRTRKYCYILLKMEQDNVKPAEDSVIGGAIAKMRSDLIKGEKIADDYMSRKGITDTDQLTDRDSQAIAEEFTKSEMSSAPVSQRQHVMSQMEIINQYMKEKGISSMASLTAKDQKEIAARMMENAILSWPEEQRAVVDDYMKSHKIAAYRNMTEKDFKAVSKLIEKKVSQQKKSSSRKKTR